VKYDEISEERKKDVTYAQICVNYQPETLIPRGNLINYPGNVGTRTADMLTVKLLLNSGISMPGAKFMTMDISNFYLTTPLDRYKHVRM
jgi:hypothetical protein